MSRPADENELLKQWLRHPGMPEDLREDLEVLRGNPQEVADRFKGNLVFGTGGLRGLMGAGPTRMNVYTVAQATAGLAALLKQRNASPSCAVAYDTRQHSALFAQIAASLLANRGIHVHLFQEPVPTPMLSYAVRHLRCDGGLVITASHNPAGYNGYKVYEKDGCQIGIETAALLSSLIAMEPGLPDLPMKQAEEASEWILPVAREVFASYEEAVLRQSVLPPAHPLHVVYSPLHGTGGGPVGRVLGRVPQIKLTFVPEQSEPDGRFPTCPKPNPELPEAMSLAASLTLAEGADLCLVTDPDCDRVGVGVRCAKGIRLLSGNEVGILLLHFLCDSLATQKRMPARPVAVKTLVTAPQASAIAKDYGVELRDTLPGFKFIGAEIARLEEEGGESRFLFGFEESAGYLAGTYVRDKDAVCACLLICELASAYLAKGMTLSDALSSLDQRYGHHVSRLVSIHLEGPGALEKMKRAMDTLRSATRLGPFQALKKTDYLASDTGFPAADILRFDLESTGCVIIRPSGTEPQIKAYLNVAGHSQSKAAALLAGFERAFRQTVASSV